MTQAERKLRKAELGSEIDNGEIIIKSPNEVEVYVSDYYGDHDWDATEELNDKVVKVLGWGGFKCGYGGWVLQKNHRSYRQFNTR